MEAQDSDIELLLSLLILYHRVDTILKLPMRFCTFCYSAKLVSKENKQICSMVVRLQSFQLLVFLFPPSESWRPDLFSNI